MTGLGGKALQRQVEEGFPFLPSGSQIVLDPVARDSYSRTSDSRSLRDGRRWCPKCVHTRTIGWRRTSMPPDVVWKTC